jgi:hypothetical protein
MANQLKIATIDTIVALHQRGWSFWRIANVLGIHRDTVARHLQIQESPPKSARAAGGSAEEARDCLEPIPAAPTEGAHAAQTATAEESARPANRPTR